jgi:hypothetical protein
MLAIMQENLAWLCRGEAELLNQAVYATAGAPGGSSCMRSYRTSSITASRPAISTVSPGPCVRTARASGDT